MENAEKITDQEEAASLQTTSRYFNFLFEFQSNVVKLYTRQKEKIGEAGSRICEFFSPVVSFFAFFFGLFSKLIFVFKSVYSRVNDIAHFVVYYDYKDFVFSLSVKTKVYFYHAKTEAYYMVCIPIKRRYYQVKKKARKKYYDLRVYFRGFREICRRLYLLASDYIPGGRWTVSFLLLIAALFITVETYRYSKVVFRLFDLFLSAILFVLQPVFWTLYDLGFILRYGLNLFLSLLKYIVYLLVLCVHGIFDFIFRVIAAFSSRIYRSLVWFLNLRLVKFFWQILLELTLIFLEIFIFKVVPFMAVVCTHLANIGGVLGTYFYNYFVAVYDGKESTSNYWSNTRAFAAIMTLFALLLAYRYRNRFSIKVQLDKDPTPARTKLQKSLRLNSEDGQNEVNFKLSSTAPICHSFLREECTKGNCCENHHCPWQYHWQYRVPVQGWLSFSQIDCDVIEKFYCDPVNELVRTTDINPDLSAMTRRSHIKSSAPIKLDFQKMRMEVSYHQSEIRRLSTESTGKSPDEMATKWIWYRLTDQGQWTEYGNKAKPKEEDIEKSFLARESSFTYKKQGQEYRIYFFMTPMYERNMNPREYKRRYVRRRPLYRSLDDQ